MRRRKDPGLIVHRDILAVLELSISYFSVPPMAREARAVRANTDGAVRGHSSLWGLTISAI